MKVSLIAFGCILFGAAACTAPQGKKLSANAGGLPPVATGPVTTASTIFGSQLPGTEGETVSMARNGTVTVMLDSANRDGYKWRLAEIPDSSVLKVVSREFVPSTKPEATGQEKWVFQGVGPGDVDVKMWYGDMVVTPDRSKPDFNFVASVSEQTKADKPEKAGKKAAKTKKTKKSVEA